jgi:hypothetical protein
MNFVLNRYRPFLTFHQRSIIFVILFLSEEQAGEACKSLNNARFIVYSGVAAYPLRLETKAMLFQISRTGEKRAGKFQSAYL